MCDWGFIYVLHNDYMPGVVKIGMTTRPPSQRCAELKGTGVPGEYEVAFAVETPNVSVMEAAVHRKLLEIRIPGGEFFKCPTGVAASVIRYVCENATMEMHGCPSILTDIGHKNSDLKLLSGL